MRFFLFSAVALLFATVTQAAELAGVPMPDTQDAAGKQLLLNGVALRTYSLLQFEIYVAGLYMPARSSDPASIIASDQPRLLRFVFMRDVSAEAAQKSWRDSLAESCHAPCTLPPEEVSRFLAGIPSVHRGDVTTMLFTGQNLEISMNGRLMGKVPDPAFDRVILSTFIGAHPTAERVKAGLLGLRG